MERLKYWCRAALAVIYPRVCEVCGRALVEGEEMICLSCSVDMPRIHICSDADANEVLRRVASTTPLFRGASFFYYHKNSPYARLIQRAKYNGRPDIDRHLARRFAIEILPSGFFSGIDAIVPVPIHFLKRLSRGYNQSYHIALGLSDATGIAVSQCLKARRPHASQTRLSPFDRWRNTRHTFRAVSGINPSHVLIVDDVLTTGATLTACAQAIHAAYPNTRISILTLALAAH